MLVEVQVDIENPPARHCRLRMTNYGAFNSRVPFQQLPDAAPYYELLETIGEGTYGEVYVAESRATKQKVAIKVLEISNDILEEIEEEYLILTEFGGKHPNLPLFYGAYVKPDHQADQMWFVIELCSGGSVTDLVKKLLEKHRKLDEDIIAYILKSTLEALTFLHSRHVIHRDIKGQNILLTDLAQVKLVDFGVAAHLRTADGRRNTSVGTPYFMAPEVIACEQQLDSSYDVRSDVWSCGIVAIELCDGEPPNANLHPMRALFKIPRSPPPSVKNPKEWSPALCDFVKQCLIKDWEKRPMPKDLLRHPFILQLHDVSQVQRKLRNLLITLHGLQKLPARMPVVTTKRGQFKTSRKSKHELVYGDDLAALEVLDEAVIVDHLFNRYIGNQIYTYVGDVLIAVNPSAPIEIYSDEIRNLYSGCAKCENPPHIFGVTDSVYHAMLQLAQNQCIVISGESGSGKTESAKYLLQHLTKLGRALNKDLEQKILTINPVIEAFGNAKTGINDNSSRFGKYLEMLFSPSGKVTGAKLSEYLLEKGRVVFQSATERNFHVLYYIYDGLGRSENQQEDSYHLRPTHGHRYLAGYVGDNPSLVSAHREKFMLLHKSLNTLGFKIQELTSMYRVLAAILHLGDIQFSTKEVKHMADRSVVSNLQTLAIVGKLLGVDVGELRDSLTMEMVVTRGETILRAHTVFESRNVRDSLAKALYGRLFDWIVNKMNQLLMPAYASDKEISTVGILDIFGFENFAQNSFEQLCINITNEQLQYFFNHSVFTWEQKEYAEEGLDWIPIIFCDNRPILDLFLSKPVGLLALLDEESRFPKATDHSLAEKFHYNLRLSAYYTRNKVDVMKFTVEHFAGKIEYDVHGFLDKNRDYLATEVIHLMRTSDVQLLRILFHNPLTKTGNLYEAVTVSDKTAVNSSSLSVEGSVGLITHKATETKNQNKRLRTLASQTRAQQTISTYFRYSLMDLLTKIVASTPHFIRCIKPNDQKLPNFFCTSKVRQQLSYTGVLETARIRRQGFPYRIQFSEFLKRYHMLGFSFKDKITMNSDSCRILLQRLKLEGWAIGRTKVFLKYYHIDYLSKLLTTLLDAVILVQANTRRWIARKRYLAYCRLRHHCACTIQRVFRGWRVRKRYQNLLREIEKQKLAIAQFSQAGHQISRKRPCVSPLSSNSDNGENWVSPRDSNKERNNVVPNDKRCSKRLRDTVEKPLITSAPMECPLPLRSSVHNHVAGRTNSAASTPTLSRPTGVSTDGQGMITRQQSDTSKRPRVRDVIAVFERSTVSDSGSEGSSSRSASWSQKENKPDFNTDRPPCSKLHSPAIEKPVSRGPSFRSAPVHVASGHTEETRIFDQLNRRESREARSSHQTATQNSPDTNLKSPPGQPVAVEETADFRKFLRKSNWDPAQTLSRSYMPVGQVDFRSVLRSNRKGSQS